MQMRLAITNTDSLDPHTQILVKLFFMDKESATVAVRKFRLQKNMKTGKESSTTIRLIKLVQLFDQTGLFEDRVRSGRPSLRIIGKRFMASSGFRFDSSRLLAEGILKFQGVLILSIQSVGIER
ncbi:hypothetical protein TNCV_2759291 [Trichonephila clavipes]|nr:hypothetical protein TNCV_2759291 [Trichonephila clavipes]